MCFLQGQTFVKELDRVLGIADEAQQSKTLKQFQEWDTNVHGAIQVALSHYCIQLLSERPDPSQKCNTNKVEYLYSTDERDTI